MSANNYQVGGSLDYKHPTYVKRQADEDLYQELKKGEYCYVLNSRQMGKSSLKVQMMKRLEKEGVRCVSIYLPIKDSYQKKFYADIAYTLSSNFNLLDINNFSSWWLQHKLLQPVECLNRFIQDVLLKRILQNIVIFVDEFESILNLEFKDEFLQFIRRCYEKRPDNIDYERLTFCILGVMSPSDLIQDKERLVFNIGQPIELTGFKLEEAKLSLTKGLEQKVDNPENVLKEILQWTGGQPFLTQKLCKLVVEKAESRQLKIEDLVQNYIINNWTAQDEPEHLRTIRNRLLSNQQRAEKLLKLYQQILQNGEIDVDDRSKKQMELRLSGLVVRQKGCLKVYNPIYNKVFNEDWVDDELFSLSILHQEWEEVPDVLVSYKRTKEGVLLEEAKDSKLAHWFRYNRLITATCVLLTINAISLFCSYSLFPCNAWQEKFNSDINGGTIEFFRSVISVTGGLYMIGVVFKREAIQILHKKSLQWLRILITFLAFILVIRVLYHNLHTGPIELASYYGKDIKNYEKDCYRTYLSYLPYSLINFVIIGVPLASVSIYTAVKDIIKSSINKNKISQFIHKLEKQSDSLLRKTKIKNLENFIQNNFIEFSSHFLVIIGRYTTLVSGFIIINIFEYLIGQKTLSESAKHLVIAYYCFGCSSIFIIFFGFSHYEIAFRKTSRCLSRLNCDYTNFEEKYNSIRFCQRLLYSNINLSITIVVTLLVFVYFLLK
ncbi:MAG: AAA-like domain-containing protein [Iphinoe sp. HA4291-MV1]|jgi:uncharacterized membrane protein YuzA (DUF378 family)|nr:AAA-like domain-containing protein [Iphinoe sp. HA4291-MV1]